MAIWRGPGGPGDAVPDQANSAQLAENFANAAAASAASALTSQTNAAASAAAALVSESNASTSASQASSSESNAASSASAALASEQAAALSESNAASSEANALASEQAAALSEAAALASEQAAALSEAAALASEQAAASSEANALASEQAAALSESNAASSESNAASSESNAASSEANALASEQAAALSEANALASEQAAALSESNAASSESNAASSEANALASEQAAALSESNAASSESNAAASEAKAQQWATEAEDVPVETSPSNLYSAFHWAQKAEDFAQSINPANFVDLASAQTITGVKTFDNGLNTDTISEETAAAGVTVDGVLLKDSEVTTDVINEKTSATGVTIDGVLLKDSQVTTDQINEKTSAAGVTIDSVLLKDNKVTANELTINSNNISADNSLGFRNRIINGDMRIDQRNNGAVVTINATDNIYVMDRWRCRGESGDGVFTCQQDSTVPTGQGFKNSAKITVTTADASIAASQIYGFQQLIEGFNVADLDWGTAAAKTVTLSFWVRSSLTGTFGGALSNGDFDRSYPFTYTISSANTWEQKSLTIVGDTTGTWLSTNGLGIRLNFSLGVGSDRQGTAGAWNGNNNLGATGETSVIGTNGATFYITGVQLEVGSVATPFERRDYGRELALCQRYLKRVLSGKTGTGAIIASGAQLSTTAAFLGYVCNPPMRAAPTVTYDNLIISDGLSFDSTVTSFVVEGTSDCIYLVPNFSAAGAQHRPVHLRAISNTTGSINFSSEL